MKMVPPKGIEVIVWDARAKTSRMTLSDNVSLLAEFYTHWMPKPVGPKGVEAS